MVGCELKENFIISTKTFFRIYRLRKNFGLGQVWARLGRNTEHETDSPLDQFQCTFLVLLKDVDSDIPLEDVIVEQHKLKVEPSMVKYILENTNCILILDGYDEYRKGTNRHIDERISGQSGKKGFVIITSRPGDYMKKQDRNKMGEKFYNDLSRDIHIFQVLLTVFKHLISKISDTVTAWKKSQRE